MKAIQKMSGKTTTRPDCSIERNQQRADEDHEDRLEELRHKAVVQLRTEGIAGTSGCVTQVGQQGFHYALADGDIPQYESWLPNTLAENRRIFNA